MYRVKFTTLASEAVTLVLDVAYAERTEAELIASKIRSHNKGIDAWVEEVCA